MVFLIKVIPKCVAKPCSKSVWVGFSFNTMKKWECLLFLLHSPYYQHALSRRQVTLVFMPVQNNCLFMPAISFRMQKEDKDSQGWPGHFMLWVSIVTIQSLAYLTFELLSPEFRSLSLPSTSFLFTFSINSIYPIILSLMAYHLCKLYDSRIIITSVL